MNQAGARWLAAEARRRDAANEVRARFERPVICDPTTEQVEDDPPHVMLVREWYPIEYWLTENDKLALMKFRDQLPRAVRAA